MQSCDTRFVGNRFALIGSILRGIFAALFLFVLTTGCTSSQPQPPSAVFPQPALLLHQPDPILTDRLKDAKTFAAFIRRIQSESDSYFRRAQPRAPQTLDVVVILKPGHRDRFWLVYEPTQPDQAPDRALLKNLQAIYPPPVEKGPVSFSLRFLLWGAVEPDARGPRGPLLPPEWRDAIGTNQNVVIPDGIIPKVWPDK
jgi:hypothetical protein